MSTQSNSHQRIATSLPKSNPGDGLHKRERKIHRVHRSIDEQRDFGEHWHVRAYVLGDPEGPLMADYRAKKQPRGTHYR